MNRVSCAIATAMTGYETLAALFGRCEDLAMYRRLAPLNATRMLCMQAELLHLEQELKTIIQIDSKSPEKNSFGIYWKALNDAPCEGGKNPRKEKIVEIKQKIKEYCAALLQTAEINRLAKLRDCDLKVLLQWLQLPFGGNFFLKGLEAQTWSPEASGDLVALSGRSQEKDQFAQFMSDFIVPWYHRRIGQSFQKPVSEGAWSNIWEYKYKVFVVLGDVICMLLSSVVPVISIFALYFVKSMLGRLAVITAMSFMFSLIMTFIVQGRRVDVFAATTAFAAVQVVFVGGQITSLRQHVRLRQILER